MSSKKRHSNRKYSNRINRTISKSTNGEKSYYKLFVLYCIILLAGYYLSQYFGVYYLEFSFMYIVIIPICFIWGLYFKYIKKLKKGLLYITLGCILHDIFTVFNCKYWIYELTGYTFVYVRDRECCR